MENHLDNDCISVINKFTKDLNTDEIYDLFEWLENEINFEIDDDNKEFMFMYNDINKKNVEVSIDGTITDDIYNDMSLFNIFSFTIVRIECFTHISDDDVKFVNDIFLYLKNNYSFSKNEIELLNEMIIDQVYPRFTKLNADYSEYYYLYRYDI